MVCYHPSYTWVVKDPQYTANNQVVFHMFFIAHILQDTKNDGLENVSPASNMAILGCLC